MRRIKLLLALTLFAVATVLFLRLVDGITLGSSLIIVGVLAVAGITLSFVGLPKALSDRKR